MADNISTKMDDLFDSMVDLCEEMLQYPPRNLGEISTIRSRYTDGHKGPALDELWHFTADLLRDYGKFR